MYVHAYIYISYTHLIYNREHVAGALWYSRFPPMAGLPPPSRFKLYSISAAYKTKWLGGLPRHTPGGSSGLSGRFLGPLE